MSSTFRNPIASFQKIYDDAHLICSTAIYFENLSNEHEALRCWRNALEQLIYQQYANRLPAGYVPRSETEKALLDSLRKLEAQCRERVELLETLERSRRESGDTRREAGLGGGRVRNIEGVAALGGTILPMDYPDLAKPPPLPTRPTLSSGSISAESGADLVLSPTRSKDDANSDRKFKMKTSLRPEGRAKPKSPSAGSSNTSLQGPAAAKAATQAWSTKKSRSAGRQRSRAELVDVHEGMEKLEISGKSSGKLKKNKHIPLATMENQDPFNDDAELKLAPSKSGGYSSADSGLARRANRPKVPGSKPLESSGLAGSSEMLHRNPLISQSHRTHKQKSRHEDGQSAATRVSGESSSLPRYVTISTFKFEAFFNEHTGVDYNKEEARQE